MKLSFASFCFAFICPRLTAAVCYYPDGSVAPQDTACQNNQDASTCCGQGYACLSNNICVSTGDEIQKGGASTYVRGSCTDQTWRSNNCPQFCINPSSDLLSGGNGIAKCPNTDLDEYYCIDSIDSGVNCTAESDVLIFYGTPSVITTIGLAASTSTISSTVSTSSSSVATSAIHSSSHTSFTSMSSAPASTATQLAGSNAAGSPHRTLAIALGVALPIGAIIIALLAYIAYRHRRNKAVAPAPAQQRYNHENGMRQYHPPSYHSTVEHKPELPGSHVGVLSVHNNDTVRHELPASNTPRFGRQ